MKKGLVFMVMFLFCASFVAAQGYFSVTSKALQNRIMINDEAKFEVTIENNLGFDEDFRIYYTDVEWGFSTEPRTATTTRVPDGEKRTVEVLLKPLYVGYGSHGVTLSIKSVKTEKLVRHPVLVNIISLGQWSPGKPIAVRTEIDMPREIDPRVDFKIRIDIENQYAINVSDLVVSAKSGFFEAEETLELRPLEKKPVEFTIHLDPMLPPQKGIVHITLTSEGQMFKEVEREVEVIAYASLVKEEQPAVKTFLRTDRSIVVTNRGNAKVEQAIKTEAPAFALFYVFSKPRAKISREGSKRYLVWELALYPDEPITIRITESYRPIIIIHVLIIGGILLYFICRSPLLVRKEGIKVKLEEGGLSQIKVLLHVRNRTRTRIRNVQVLDRVPNLADIVKTFKIGSLQPVKILRHEKKGSIAKWFIEELDPYEERIIAYKIRARLTILGSFELPSAISKFRDARGRDRTISSNRITVRV